MPQTSARDTPHETGTAASPELAPSGAAGQTDPWSAATDAPRGTIPSKSQPHGSRQSPAHPLPPGAFLEVDSSLPAAGVLGAFSFGGLSAGTPWLPAASLDGVRLPASSERLTVRLARSDTFVRWLADLAPASDESGGRAERFGEGGDGTARRTRAELARPPAGHWIMVVRIVFSDGRGAASYHWEILAP